MITQATIVTLALFVVGLVYHAGQMSNRVTHLEKQSDKVADKIDAIFQRIDQIRGMIRGEET